MGIQDTAIGEISGASLLVIDQACDNSQLLISLCRNGSEWLSPVGWTEKQKITLLDCRSQGGSTEIDIPAEFAKVLVSGDSLVLKCSELDLTQDIIWKASHVQTRPTIEVSSEPVGFAKGVLSRFLSAKPKDVVEPKSDAQRRAEEADRAAQTYRKKMEEATAAKEEAQRKALEAAREAEAALKMEAERIAEMERAAKAFEEAQRLKQDELRRVEEERIAEEARIVEEARRIEESKRREAEAKQEAERQAALERYATALDITRNEEDRLRMRLTDLKADTESYEAQKLEQTTKILSFNEALDTAVKTAEKSRNIFENTAVTLDEVSTNVAKLQHKSDALSSENAVMQDRVTELEADYHKAQREAEMAKALAEEKRIILDALRQDKELIFGNLVSVTHDLEARTQELNDTTAKTQTLRAEFESSQSHLKTKKAEIKSLEDKLMQLTDSRQTHLIEIEATQQAIEDCQTRLSTHQEAIAHLEAGGDPKSISDRYVEADGIERSKRSFLWNKAAKISIDVDDVALEEAPLKEERTDEMLLDVLADQDQLEPVDLKPVETNNEVMVSGSSTEFENATKGFFSRNSKKLLAIGAIIGGASILAGGYAAVQSSKPETLTAKMSIPSPVNVASAKAAVNKPGPKSLVIEGAVETKMAPLSETIIRTVSVVPIPDVAIPNLTPTGLSLEKASSKTTPVKTETAKKITSVNKAVIQKKKSAPKNEKIKNYPELTTRVQTQLKSLGFYSGDLNGLQTPETKEAIKRFQNVNGLPIHGRISGKFLSAIIKAEAQQNAPNSYVPIQVPPASNFKPTQRHHVVTVEPQLALTVYDIQKSVPVTEVATEHLEPQNNVAISQPITPTHQSSSFSQGPSQTSALAIKDDVSVNFASTSIAVSPSLEVKADVVVEAKRTKAYGATYPVAAAKRNYFVDARIIVGYDIDTSGKVINTHIVSNDHEGRFNDAFERAAKTAVKRQKFSPKTVNGQAVQSMNQTQRIVFKAG